MTAGVVRSTYQLNAVLFFYLRARHVERSPQVSLDARRVIYSSSIARYKVHVKRFYAQKNRNNAQCLKGLWKTSVCTMSDKAPPGPSGPEVPGTIGEIGRFPDRLKQAIGGKSIRAFARETGLSETVLRQYLTGQSEPTRPALIVIARTASVNVAWLATGHPVIMGGGHWKVTESPTTYIRQSETVESYTLVPKHDLMTGNREVLHSEQIVDHLAFKSEWLVKDLGVDPHTLALVSARGDSMEPTISQGDLLLLDLSQRRVGDEAIYALVVEDGVLAKRIQRLLDGMLSVRCDNPAYKEQLVPKEATETLRVLGRVVWVGRRI